MTNSILIGKLLYNILSQDENISSKVGNGIFPIVAENNTKFPFIVYSKTNIYNTILTKDGGVEDTVSFDIITASDKYFESAELANEVRNLFENCIMWNDSLKIYNIYMNSISESYNENTYIQTMNFTCRATNNVTNEASDDNINIVS